MAKMGLKFEGWEEYIAKLDKVGGSSAMKSGVDKALKESKKYVTPQIEKAMSKSNLPAGGKYSTGRTKSSIDVAEVTEWEGMTGGIKVGFNMKKSGMTSIFLMYGTPRMKPPVSGLKSAIYGAKTQKAIGEIQEKELAKAIKEIMGG